MKRIEGKTALYRYFDGDGVLLYVGISANPFKRISARSYDFWCPWWTEIRTMEIEWFCSLDEAQKAERDAIKTGRPLHNKLHNPRKRSVYIDANAMASA